MSLSQFIRLTVAVTFFALFSGLASSRAAAPPAATPPAATASVAKPPAAKPPAVTLPVATPPAATLPAAKPPAATPPAASGPRDSGTLAWVVAKVSLSAATDKSDVIVADFATEKEAQACVSKLISAEKEKGKWHYAYRSRLPDSATVAGQTYQGKIGHASVVIGFAAAGEFQVFGEMEGPGKWTQNGAGLLLETATSWYRGQLEGERLSGLRFLKDGSEPAREWNVLRTAPSPSGPVGRWVDQTIEETSATTVTVVLRPDNSGFFFQDYDFPTPNGGLVRSRQLSVQIRWRLETEPGPSGLRRGIMLERVGGDQPWTTKWIDVNGAELADPWKKLGL